MKYRKLMLVTLVLLAILTLGAVSASEDVNSTDMLTVETMDEVSVDASDDEIVSLEDEQILESSDAEVQSVGNTTVMESDLEVSVSDVEYGEPAVAEITVVQGPGEGNLLVNLDDENIYTVSFMDYQASCTFEDLDVGTHTVTVTYEGSEIYESATATASFEVFEAEDEEGDDWILDYNSGMISFRELVTLSDRFNSGLLEVTDSNGNVLFRRNVSDMECNHNMKGYKYDQFRGYVVFKEDLNTTQTGVYDLTITYYDDENEVVESANPTVYLDYTSNVNDAEIDITDYDSTLVSFYVFNVMNNGYFEIEVFDGEDTDEDPFIVKTIDVTNQMIGGTIELTNDAFKLGEGIYTIRVRYVPNDEDPNDHEVRYWKYTYFHDARVTVVDNTKFRVRMISESILDENSQFLVYCPNNTAGKTITIKVTSEDTSYSFDFEIIEDNEYNLFAFGDLNISAPGLYEFDVYDENGDSLIETYEYEIGNPLHIPDVCVLGAVGLERTPVVVLYIDKIDNGRLVLTDEEGVELFNETLTDEYYESLGYEEGYYILYNNCNPALNEGTYNFTASYYIIDDYGQHLRLSHTSEIRIVERNYVVDNDTGIAIELFDYEDHNLNDDEDFIAWVSVPEYESGYVTVVLTDDEDNGYEFTFDEIDDDDGLPTFFVSLFDEDIDEGDYLVNVTYFDGDDNPVLSSSTWMSFHYGGDDEEEDGPIDEVEFCPPEPEEEFEIGENVVVAHLYVPDSFDDDITIYVYRNDDEQPIYTENTANMEHGYDETKEAKDYSIALDLTQLNNEDVIYFKFDYWGEDVFWAEVVQVDGDNIIFWDDPDFNRLEFSAFYGNLTTGTFNDPDMMGGHFEGRVIIITISDSWGIEDATITVSDGETTYFTKQLSEIDDKYYDFSSLGYEYAIYFDEFNPITLPEDTEIFFTFTSGDITLTQKRMRVMGDYLAKGILPEDVTRLFDVEITDETPYNAVNNADPIVSIVATWDANRQSIYMDLGAGQFNVYVNDEEIEGLGVKVLYNWIYNSDILETEDYEYLEDLGIDPDEFLELNEDGKVEYLYEKFAEDFGSEIELFRICSVYEGWPELFLYAEDLNITENGKYNIKITHVPDPAEEPEPGVLPDYSIDAETLVLEKDVTVMFEPIETILSGEDLVMRYRDGSAWEICLTDIYGNTINGVNVAFSIYGKTYNRRTDENGVAGLTINLARGTYGITATFEGNDNYGSSSVNATVTVINTQAILNATDLVMAPKDGSAWNVTVTDSSGKALAKVKIAFTISSATFEKTYKITADENGVASLPIGLGVGVYNVTAVFEGTAKIDSGSVSATITVRHPPAVLTAEDLTMAPKDGSAWDVTLISANGNPIANATIKFSIVNKTYKIKTDENGVASLPIGLSRGVYEVSATFDGDSENGPASINATVTVKYPTNLVAVDMEMTYKDGSEYTVTLTDSNGAGIANKIVKVTINGKTYNRRTNDDGVATLPIGLAPGTYEVTASFEEDSYYATSETTSTVTVNRA